MRNDKRSTKHLAGLVVAPFLLSLVSPAPAIADSGVGMLMVTAVPAWALLLVLIVPLEAVVVRRVLNVSWYSCFKLSTLANLVSTLFGIVLTWASLLCGQVFWYMDPVNCWTLPANELAWCVPCFFVSVWIEGILVRKITAPEQHTAVRKWAWKANLYSYAVLFLLLSVILFQSIQYSRQNAHSYDVPTSGTPALDVHLQYWKWAGHHSIEQQTRLAQMLSLMARGKYIEALPICNTVLRGQPQYSWGHACRSFIERNLKMDDAALADAELAIKEDSTYDVGYGSRADVLYAIGVREGLKDKIENAINDYSEAIRFSKSDDATTNYYVGQARCHVFLGNFGKALLALNAIPSSASSKEAGELRSVVLEKLG